MSAEDFFLSAEEFVQQHQALMLKVLREYSQYPEGTHSTPAPGLEGTLEGTPVVPCGNHARTLAATHIRLPTRTHTRARTHAGVDRVASTVLRAAHVAGRLWPT